MNQPSPLTDPIVKLTFMQTLNTLKERMEELVQVTGWDVNKIKSVAGVSSSAVSQWMGKGSKEIHSIQIEPAIRLAMETGFNPLWLSKGQLPKKWPQPDFVMRKEDGTVLVIEAKHVSESDSKPTWPFESVAYERWARLSERQKGRVEQAVIEVLTAVEWESKNGSHDK